MPPPPPPVCPPPRPSPGAGRTLNVGSRRDPRHSNTVSCLHFTDPGAEAERELAPRGPAVQFTPSTLTPSAPGQVLAPRTAPQ